MIYRADTNKPHRCPVCYTIPDIIWEEHPGARYWYVYTCRHGHRFTRIWPAGRPLHGLTVESDRYWLRLRWRGWLALLCGRGERVSWCVDWDEAGVERYWTILAWRGRDPGVNPYCRVPQEAPSRVGRGEGRGDV